MGDLRLERGRDDAMTAPTPVEGLAEIEQVSVLQYATLVLRHRRLSAVCAAVLFLTVVLARSFGDRLYTSSASFVPQSSDQMSGLAGLAAQLGVAPAGPEVTESPAFYSDLLKSREVLTAVLQSEYRFPTDTGVASAELIDLLRVRARTDGLRMAKAIRKLTSLLRVSLRTKTGVIALEVRMPNPVLAQEVAQKFLDEVNRFNLERRQSQAGAERRFTDGRIAELQRQLRDAEDQLQGFLQRNRDFANSPELTFQRDRLAQEVQFRQSVYTTVSQSNEQARMDEVKDTPVITVVERPNLPPKDDGRGRLTFGALALILGSVVGTGIGVGRDAIARRRASEDEQFGRLTAAARDTRADIRQLWRRARTVVARSPRV
jgi:uncharacterized protein involved in exopolysaccharide biosynthesis